jgi:hypothetical protein
MGSIWRNISLIFATLGFIVFSIFSYIIAHMELESFKPTEIDGREFNRSDYASAIGDLTGFVPTIPYPVEVTSIPLKYTSLPRPTVLPACVHCWIASNSPLANSSARDLVLSFLSRENAQALQFRFKQDEFTFYRSLRSSGCKASIVILAEETVADNISRACGVNVISVGTISESDMQRISIVRHWLFAKFLMLYQKDFDRVIICNPLNSLAQGDPFTFHFTSNFLLLPRDAVDIVDSPMLAELEIVDHYFDKGVYANARIILDNVICGSVNAVLKMYEIVMKHDRFESGKAAESFSSYLAYCSANGLFDRYGLRISFSDPGNDMTLMQNDSLIFTKWSDEESFSQKSLIVASGRRPPLLLSVLRTHGLVFDSACIGRPFSRSKTKYLYTKPTRGNRTLHRPPLARKNWRRR